MRQPNRIPSTRHRDCRPVPAPFLLPLLLLLLLAGPLLLPGTAAAEDEPNTMVVAPMVHAPAGTEELAALTDRILTEILRDKGLLLIPRQETGARIGYDNWPPDHAALAPLVPSPAVNYVVVGSVTRFGEQLSLDFSVYDLAGKTIPKYYYRVSKSETELRAALQQLIDDILTYTGRYFLIESVSIAGNKRIDAGAVLRQVKSKSGDRYAADRLRSDLAAIFQMGYFDDVQILVTDSEKGKAVTFQVTEKAVIGQIHIQGTKELKEKEVREVISISANTIINPKEVQNSVENIKTLYRDKGFYRTEVTADIKQTDKDRVNISFVVEEGVKVYIRGIRFSGNTAFTDKELRKEMSTSEKGLLSWLTESGKLKRDLLEQDRARIGALYHNSGFLEARIGEPAVTYEEDRLYINIDIEEGARYRVGTIEIEGDIIGDKNDLFQFVELGQEKFFSRKILRDDMLRLTDHYAEKGYAFADVEPALRKNAEDLRMDVTIRISKGNLVHVNRVNIKGNTRTRDRVIRREIMVQEGGILDAGAVRKSSERLQRLGYFEEVNVRPEPTVQENIMDVVVELKEKPTGTFSIGAGYSSVDSLMFMSQISENNFLGKGQKLSLQANLSSSSTQYNLSFTEPRLNDTKLLFGYDLYNWSREYDDYTKNSTGGSLRFAYPVWEKWHLGWGYGFDDTKLTDVLPTASLGIRESLDIETTSYIRLGLSKDTRDKFVDPSKGALTSLSIKHAGLFLGGDSSFTKYEASSSWYYPLWKETVFHVKGSMGYVIENEDRKLPVYEKFYLGGMSTIRGFDNGKISPLEPNGLGGLDRVGGEKMWYANFEWIFPLFKEAGLKGLIFYDTGNVYRDSENWSLDDLRHSVGVGFRWLSPMGPLRLEWGYNLDPEPGEKQGLWDFSIGGMF